MVAISRILAIILLCSVCFFTVLRFAAPLLTSTSLRFYLLMSFLHSVAMLALAWLINKTAPQSANRNIALTGVLFFLSGVFFVAAFGMGAPPKDAIIYLENSTHEIWRFIFLMLAAILTTMGLILFYHFVVRKLSKALGFIFLLLVIAAALITMYDFWWGTFTKRNDIRLWSEAGKDLNLFFREYDLKNSLRGIGRCLIYLVSIFTFIIGWRAKIIKPWLAIILTLISFYFFQDVLRTLISDVSQINSHIGMVPAVALSPLYLLGVYWISMYKYTFINNREVFVQHRVILES